MNEITGTPDRLERPFEDYTPEELFALFKPPKPGRVEATAEELASRTAGPVDPSVKAALANLASRDREQCLKDPQS